MAVIPTREESAHSTNPSTPLHGSVPGLPLKDYDYYFQKLYKQGVEAMLKAGMKTVHPTVDNVEKKWTLPVSEWGTVINQLIIKFGDRCGIK